MAAVDPSTRKRVLKVIFVSLLLDLISFTFILPLFPKLLEFYRNSEAGPESQSTLLARILSGLNAYKSAFAKPIDSRYDIVLLGGALGSLFSLLQAIASPVIGRLSDKYGRRTALLASMAGNIVSVLLWVLAVDFRTFLASRVVGGLSEGNVQLATAIATDISDEHSRGRTMALIGACFSVAFTFGPALGAYLSSVASVAANPFATAAGVSLFLIVSETVYLYLALPETLPSMTAAGKKQTEQQNGTTNKTKTKTATATATAKPKAAALVRTNSHALLNLVHFAFLLFFSGMEFSLPFMTYELFQYSSSDNGRLLGYVGLVASLLQGGLTRRLPPLLTVRVGVAACLAAFALLGRIGTVRALYAAATCLAATSATVVSGLNTLSSFEAGEDERGGKLGILRSYGQLGRGLGPVLFTSVYWWAGREVAYGMGALGILGVTLLVFAGLKAPPASVRQKGVVAEEKKEL
ncbi:MFS general substrate transporter [Whalleya microplaca]|nr:MFS general substrate transporter [Whalleya microplaca]